MFYDYQYSSINKDTELEKKQDSTQLNCSILTINGTPSNPTSLYMV